MEHDLMPWSKQAVERIVYSAQQHDILRSEFQSRALDLLSSLCLIPNLSVLEIHIHHARLSADCFPFTRYTSGLNPPLVIPSALRLITLLIEKAAIQKVKEVVVEFRLEHEIVTAREKKIYMLVGQPLSKLVHSSVLVSSLPFRRWRRFSRRVGRHTQQGRSQICRWLWRRHECWSRRSRNFMG